MTHQVTFGMPPQSWHPLILKLWASQLFQFIGKKFTVSPFQWVWLLGSAAIAANNAGAFGPIENGELIAKISQYREQLGANKQKDIYYALLLGRVLGALPADTMIVPCRVLSIVGNEINVNFITGKLLARISAASFPKMSTYDFPAHEIELKREAMQILVSDAGEHMVDHI